MKKILLIVCLLLATTVAVKAQCQYKTDTLKCWIVVLTKTSNYKTVKIIQAKEVQNFDGNCRGWIVGYLNMLNQPLITTGFYILHISNTKIIL